MMKIVQREKHATEIDAYKGKSVDKDQIVQADIDVLQEQEIVSKLLQGESILPQTDFTATQAGAVSSAIRTKQKIERNQDFSQFL